MEFVISDMQQGLRLDVVLAETTKPLESRANIQRSIRAGLISIDGITTTRSSTKVISGQIIRVKPPKDYLAPAITHSELNLNIVFEDDDILVIDKQHGLVVHPAPGHETGTLVNAIIYHCKKKYSPLNISYLPLLCIK